MRNRGMTKADKAPFVERLDRLHDSGDMSLGYLQFPSLLWLKASVNSMVSRWRWGVSGFTQAASLRCEYAQRTLCALQVVRTPEHAPITHFGYRDKPLYYVAIDRVLSLAAKR